MNQEVSRSSASFLLQLVILPLSLVLSFWLAGRTIPPFWPVCSLLLVSRTLDVIGSCSKLPIHLTTNHTNHTVRRAGFLKHWLLGARYQLGRAEWSGEGNSLS